jgi:DNA repair exonuclease SbcCD ATPase subunit
MSNINQFLEKECGFKNNTTNIIEKELNKKEEINKLEWDKYEINKYDSDNETQNKIEKYLYYYENNFKMIQEILYDIEYNNSFYDYIKYNKKMFDELDIYKSEIKDFNNIIENKIKYYSDQNEEFEELYQKLKNKKKNLENEKERMEEKYNNLNIKKNIKIQNIENLPPFEVLSLQDEIDKYDKEMKITKQNIFNIPEIKKEIEQEIKEKYIYIQNYKKYIEILEHFPQNLYIQYLKENYEKIQKNKNLEKKIISIRKKQKTSNIFIFLMFCIHIVEKYYNFFDIHKEIFTFFICLMTFYITINYHQQ